MSSGKSASGVWPSKSGAGRKGPAPDGGDGMGCKGSAAFSVQACQSGAKRKRPPMTEGDEWSKAFKATPLKSTGGARQVVTA